MTNQDVKKVVGDTPHMTLEQANVITEFIADNKLGNILELGFKHGVSTCYMAAALAERGHGSIVTMDLELARDLSPNIEQLLERIGERDRVQVFYEPTSYNWRMLKFLDENPNPRFDFVYVDGAHDWNVDALAFFLADRLLLPGGWIIFDDLEWSYSTSPSLKSTERVRNMPVEERTTQQVKKIYELLVKPHPGYHNFRTEHGWGFAQKQEGVQTQREIVTEHIVEHVVRVERIHVGLGSVLMKVVDKVRKRHK
jgi:predicted O-methyltransferase YrrM